MKRTTKTTPDIMREPDGIEIFGTGTTSPKDFVKHPTYLSRKDNIRYFLYADRFSFWAAVIAVCMILALVGVQVWKPKATTLGDVDMDGVVTQSDAKLILNHVSGRVQLSGTKLLNADLNGDGQITSVDALIVLQSIPKLTATPTVMPTVIPTPEITPTTVIIHLAPIVDRRIFKITAYCSCAKCCGKTDGIGYGGTKIQEGVTIAADLSVLPLGTVVDIEGIGLRTVQDNGKGVKGDHLDLFIGTDHQTALNFGVQYRMVTIFAKEIG